MNPSTDTTTDCTDVDIGGTPPGTPAIWLTRHEAADYLRISVDTLDRWRKAGRIRAYRAHDLRSLRYRPVDLDAAMAPETPPAVDDGPAHDRPTGPGIDHLIQA